MSLSPSEFEAAARDVEKAYFRNDPHRLVRHQLNSFDDFLMNKLENIIDGFNPIEIPYKFNADEEIFEYKMYIHMKNPVITLPLIYEKDGSSSMMTPDLARNRNFTYAGNMYVDMQIYILWYENGHLNESSKVINSVSLGKIPIMVNSSYCVLRNTNVLLNENHCKYDSGGYFIINGNEKVVISQDRIAENRVYIFADTKVSQYSHIAEIRSVPDNTFGAPKLTSLKMSYRPSQYGRYIRVNIHYIKVDIPLFILVRALGIETDRDIVDYIMNYKSDSDGSLKRLMAPYLQGCVYDSQHVRTTPQALEWLSSHMNMSGLPIDMKNNVDYKVGMIKQVLRKDFLPHVGDDFIKKAFYICRMSCKLIRCTIGIDPLDDRDSYINKRVDTPGVLMANLFRQYYGKLVKEMKVAINKEFANGTWKTGNNPLNIINMNNLSKIVKQSIEQGIKYSLATGNWGLKNMNAKQGVAQVLNRLTFNATLSHLRRINTPMEKSGKLIQPRKLHPTQWGIICSSETPEGSSVGLVKNMAISATITVSSNSSNVRSLVKEFGTIEFTALNVHDFKLNTCVVINGDIVGFHGDPAHIYSELRRAKLSGRVHIHTSIVWDKKRNEISICTEGGRCVRPMFIVNQDTKKTNLTSEIWDALNRGSIVWDDLVCNTRSSLVANTVIEYMDVEEMNSTMTAMTYADLCKGQKGSLLPISYTNMEIHPSMILGVMANSIPFPDHNQAPRVTYQSAMGKQAIGLHVTNYRTRMDTISHVLNYPQRPLVSTQIANMIASTKLSAGSNLMVAIATFTGYNQEDSVMVNRASVDRGALNSTSYRTYKDQCNKNHSTGEEEIFCNPLQKGVKKTKPFNYNKLNEEGFVSENTFVDNGDIIIGKCMPQKSGDSFAYKDNSTVIKNNESGYIDRICANNKYYKNVNSEGYVFSKVRIRNMRAPVIGDKVSSRHGQKGTIGMVYNPEDMPFTKDGIAPDIIMNPHAVPSRMTIGQLIECIMGKVCVNLGHFGDGTPFTDLTVTDVCDLLEKCGMERYGNEVLYNPRTGEQMKTLIFMGPTYYQRLRHIVAEKIHCTRGDHEVLTTDGWKFIPEVTTSDLVATLKDGKLVYEHPTATLRFDYNGKMYRVKNQSIDLDVTLNHKMYVSEPCENEHTWHPPALIQAKNIVGKHVKYVKNVVWDSPDYQFMLPAHENEKEKAVEMDSWLAFFGISVVQHDGLTINENRALSSMAVCFTLLSDLKINIDDAQLVNYMDTLSVGKSDKALPDWCWKLSKRQARILLQAMVLGNNEHCGDKFTFHTSSVKLADDVMRLTLHSGWSGTINNETNIADGQSGAICVSITKIENMPSMNQEHPEQSQEEEVYDYEGPVYCLQVPSQIFYVRRNGKSCWTGNSRSSSGPIVLMTRQPSEGRARDGGLRLGEMEVECNWAHGCMSFLKERIMECSDNYRMFVCKKCKVVSNVNPGANIYKCHTCKNTVEFTQVRMPFTCKLMFQEIQSMGIGTRIET